MDEKCSHSSCSPEMGQLSCLHARAVQMWLLPTGAWSGREVQATLPRLRAWWKQEHGESQAALSLEQLGHRMSPEKCWVQPPKQVCVVATPWCGLPHKAGFGNWRLGSLAAGGSTPGGECKWQNCEWHLISSKHFAVDVKVKKLLIC